MSMDVWTQATPIGELVALGVDGTLKATVVLSLALVADRVLKRAPAALRHAALGAGLLAIPWAFLSTGVAQLEAHWFAGLDPAAAGALVALYAVGVLVVLAPMAGSLRALRATYRESTDAEWLAPLRRDGGPELRVADVAVPVTFGWLRPVVLFPRAAEGWDELERRSALAHELGHIRRHDWPVQLASYAVVAGMWFHPLAWMARARMLLEAERAADDVVLASGLAPNAYAQHLLTRCAELAGLRSATVAMSPQGPKQLEQRIRAILAPSQARGGSAKALGVALVGAALLVGSMADATVVGTPEQPAVTCKAAPEAPLDRETMVTVAGATAGLARLQTELDGLSMLELEARQAAAQVFATNCPYRRGGLMVLNTVRNELARIAPATLEASYPGRAPELFARIVRLQELVEQQWRYADTLGVASLPDPQEGDFLYGVPEFGFSGDALAREADAIATAGVALHKVWPLVREMDQATQDRLEVARNEVGDDHRNLQLDAVPQGFMTELIAIDAALTELRSRRPDNEDSVGRELFFAAPRIELTALRLSMLLEQLRNQGC